MEGKSNYLGAVLIATLLVMAITFAGIFMEYNVWLIMAVDVAVAVVAVVIGMKVDRKRSFASDRKISGLIDKVQKLKGNKEDTAEVEREMEKACENSPEAWKGYRALGELFLARGERSRAKNFFQKQEKLMPESSDSNDMCTLWNQLGAIEMANGRFKEALPYYMKAAEREPVFCRGIGLMYEFGWGVDAEPFKAKELYDKAVAAGNSQAIANACELQWKLFWLTPREVWQGYADYMFGCHCGRTAAAGSSSLLDSARKGYAPAQFEIGTLYQNGQLGNDVSTMRAEAFRWLRAGADQGFLPALHNLGFLVQQGVIDPVRGDIYKPKVKGTLLYDKKEIDYCTWEGHQLILRAAEAGYAPAQHSIGMRYIIGGQSQLLEDGENVKEQYREMFVKDPVLAREWLEKAARQGFKPARDDLKTYFGAEV